MTQITLWIIGAIALLAIAAVAAAGVQSARLSDAKADLASTIDERDAARAAVRIMAQNKAVSDRALADERTAAVSAERVAADLKVQIAHDAGTARDAPTAPVLLDTIKNLRGPGH